MDTRPPGRNRPINVAVPLDLERFACELDKALGGNGYHVPFSTKTGKIRPGGGEWRGDLLPFNGKFGVAYLFQELFSKFDDKLPSPDKEAATWERFFQAEEQCRLTNHRLSYDKSRHSVSATSVWSVIELARRKIAKIVGEFSWNDAAVGFNFGPGATTRLPRRKADFVYKYSGKPETTAGNAALALACISASPLWKESTSSGEGLPFEIIRGNRIVTVPKNYKVDRTIAIEPCMNMYVQKGIGTLLRRKLRSVGFDLDCQEKNQRLALVGSISGLLATVDLSMASDTVSKEIVRHLLPSDWYEALEQCRSPVGVLPCGKFHYYHKFSSMGNGYTFELETLIFVGLCLALLEIHRIEDRRLAVYGDDIVVSTAIVPELLDIFSFCGFTVNTKKTHLSGPFRESCGKHYLSGNDVSPFYVKSAPDRLTSLFLLHNQLHRWCGRNKWNEEIDVNLMRQLLQSLRGFAPSNWRRPRIPDGFGDGAFIGTFDSCRPRVSRKLERWGWEGFEVEVIADVTMSAEDTSLGRLIKSLATMPRDVDPLYYLDPRKSAGGVSRPPRARINKMIVPRFADLDIF